MPGMFDDLIPKQPAGSAPEAGAAPPAQGHAAGMFDDLIPQTQADGAPPEVRNVPTAPDDPIYHGAVPIAQAPDMGATTAFASGVGGAPIVGPAIESGVKAVAAGARALRDGTSYDSERQRVEDMSTIARQQHPRAAFAGDLTGAVTAMAPAITAAPAAFGAGGGPLTMGQVAAGSASGGAIGAADAVARHGADPGAIALGAFGGGAGGAAGPVLGSAVSRTATAATDFAARAAALRNVGMSRPAAEIITRAAETDGTLNGHGAANIAAAGPQAMLADAGPGLATVLDTALQRGGAGAVSARRAIEQRAAAANQDLTVHLDRALGAPQGIHTVETAIRTGSAPARQPAYDAAYRTPIDYTGEAGRSLEAMVRDRVPPAIIARANLQMRMDGTPSRQIIQRPDGTLEQLPDVRQIDYITRSLNDVARGGDGQGALGGNTSEGRSYGMLARELRNTLRQAVPEYGTALETAAQPIQARNALEFGSEILRSTVPRDVAAETIQNMTGPELEQARQGLRSTIFETLGNVKRTITDPNVDARQAMETVKMLSSDAAREKMALVVGDREAGAVARGLEQALLQATRAQEMRAAVATNSRTFARTTTDESVKEAAQPGVLAKLLGGEPLQAGKTAAKFLSAQTPADITARQDAIYGELANALTGPRGPAALTMLQRLTDANNTRAAAGSIANSIPYGALSQTGILALLPSLNSRPQ